MISQGTHPHCHQCSHSVPLYSLICRSVTSAGAYPLLLLYLVTVMVLSILPSDFRVFFYADFEFSPWTKLECSCLTTVALCPIHLSAEAFCTTWFLLAVVLLAIHSWFRSWQWSALRLPFACFDLADSRAVKLQQAASVRSCLMESILPRKMCCLVKT